MFGTENYLNLFGAKKTKAAGITRRDNRMVSTKSDPAAFIRDSS